MPDLMSPEYDPRAKVDIVPVEFWVDHRPIHDRPGEFKPVEQVKWAKRGQPNHQTVEAISRVRKNPQLWNAIEPYYKHWLKGQEAPTDGTPLEAWAGVTKGQVQQLKLLLIRTVEELAQVGDGTMQRIGMGARTLVERAQAFVDHKRGSAVVEAALVSEREKRAELEGEVAELKAMVEALTPPEKRGPGRPRKTFDEAAPA